MSSAVISDAGKGDDDTERIAKVMARAGLCSRRDAEAWITAGRVTVNGKKLTSPAVNVGPLDDVRVDGMPLPAAEKTRLFRYHKPRGLVTTAKDPEGRPTVFENLPDKLPRLISVGRLDLNSEGLLLLTNDGELARRLELPATGWVRRYRVRVNGWVDANVLATLAKGIEIEGVRYGSIEAALDRQQGVNAWLTMSLTEGKNREIRKVCAHFGWTVGRLIRLSYGPFQLGHLERGEVEEVPGKVLRDQLGRPGSPPPLRPHQASGGKARPPKPTARRDKEHKHRDAARPMAKAAAGDQHDASHRDANLPQREGSEPGRRKLSHERRAERQQAQRRAEDAGRTDRDQIDRKRSTGTPRDDRNERSRPRAATAAPTGKRDERSWNDRPHRDNSPRGQAAADRKPTGAPRLQAESPGKERRAEDAGRGDRDQIERKRSTVTPRDDRNERSRPRAATAAPTGKRGERSWNDHPRQDNSPRGQAAADRKPAGTLRLKADSPGKEMPPRKPSGPKSSHAKAAGSKPGSGKSGSGKSGSSKPAGNKPASRKPAGAKRSDANRFRRS